MYIIRKVPDTIQMKAEAAVTRKMVVRRMYKLYHTKQAVSVTIAGQKGNSAVT